MHTVQVKVNSPRNLSSMYLPNATFGSMPAVVLAPNGLLNGQYAGQAIYRPLNNQPFVGYPYTGGSAGTFWYLNGLQGNPTLGPPSSGGAASIIRESVRSTEAFCRALFWQRLRLQFRILPLPPVGFRDVPTVFALAPSYLNDAPLIGRTFGESSFNTYSVGAKIRFTGSEQSDWCWCDSVL